MKINFLLLLYLLLLTFFIGCSDINDKVNNNSTTSEIENEEEADKFEGSLIITNEEELAIALKENYSITIKNDINSSNELIIEGDFSKTDTTEGNKVTHVGRKLNLFYIDSDNNTINNYTLNVPKLVIKSNDTTIKGGKIKGNIYVEAKGVILDDTKLQGNIYFKDEKLKDTFKLENTATVSGNIKVQ